MSRTTGPGVKSDAAQNYEEVITQSPVVRTTAPWKDPSKIPFKVVTCLAAILLFACSSGFPSESDGRQYLEKYYKAEAQQLKLRSFTKTNGVEEKTKNRYFLEFEAQVQCSVADRKLGQFEVRWMKKYEVTCEKDGEVKKLTGRIPFEKTEKGWRAEDGEIY